MSRTATRPLNQDAVAAADDEFYANHPEFIRPDGTRIPLSPTDPAQADLRKEWMDSYIANGGEVDDGGGSDKPIDDPAAPCPVDPTEPPPTIEAKWSKPEVTPDHNSTQTPATPPTDVVPEEAKVQCLVTTTEVPDGTTARIEIRHCETDAQVPEGTLENLVVTGNQVTDPLTGVAPEWVFEAKHKPWDPWNKPYFYFKVTVNYKGLAAETPKDYVAREAECLRVMYWHVCLAETGSLSGTLPECNDITTILNGVAHSKSSTVNYGTPNIPLPEYGSHLRNTYSFLQSSHGNVLNRTTAASISLATHGDPPDGVPDPANWRSIVHMTPSPRFGDAEIGNATDIPSVPRYLYYASVCLAGWESSFADAMIARGCQSVIAFRRTIPDSEAPVLSKNIYTTWANDHALDPSKIPDIFFQFAPSHYDNMRPVLFGPGAGQARAGGGLGAGEIALIAIAAVAVGVLAGVALWQALK